MGIADRVAVLELFKGFALCMDWTGEYNHTNCTSQVNRKPFSNCTAMVGSSECGKKHNMLLHGSTREVCNVVKNLTMPPTRSPSYTAPTPEELNSAGLSQNSLLPMQNIDVMAADGKLKNCVAFFNTGSNINLVRTAFAVYLGVPATAVTQHLQVKGKKPEEWWTFNFEIPLIKRSGEFENVIAYLMDDIIAELPHIDAGVVISLFWGVSKLQDIRTQWIHRSLAQSS